MDSKECLKNAQECMELANRVQGDDAKSEYFQLAKEWIQLAEEIDAVRNAAAAISRKRLK